ncbi:MAG: hypothetical protein DMF64_07000 [Acidobacteria bacterium]|nr:MAG: hypothetical protein DMF64_07000 [Acidobacteriota bacterium]
MSEKVNLDGVRSEVLARINRSERNFKLALFAAVAFEALFLVTFILLMERHNRMHLLLLIATVSSYSIVVLGLVALGAYFNRGVLRILKAIELLKT